MLFSYTNIKAIDKAIVATSQGKKEGTRNRKRHTQKDERGNEEEYIEEGEERKEVTHLS